MRSSCRTSKHAATTRKRLIPATSKRAASFGDRSASRTWRPGPLRFRGLVRTIGSAE
ncbi:hypothetical protein ACFPRL_05015 [Pseudoclavibacter helvolus]